MATTEIESLIKRVLGERRLPWTDQDKRLSVIAIRELAHGEPVPAERIAPGAGLTVSEVDEFLRRSTAELDDAGRLLGLGLTLRPTPHRLELDGLVLYTWCAPDGLAFSGPTWHARAGPVAVLRDRGDRPARDPPSRRP
jgi:hypothetical protein